MLDAIKIKAKSQAFFKAVKTSFNEINEKKEVFETQIIEELTRKKQAEREELLHQTKELIQSLNIELVEVEDKIEQHEPVIVEQIKKVEEEQSKLQALLQIKEDLKEKEFIIGKRLKSLINKRNKVEKELGIFAEKSVIHDDEDSEEETKMTINKVISPFHPSVLAENIRLTMIELAKFKNETEIKNILSINKEEIRFKFELIRKGVVEDTYLFITSTDIEDKVIHMYKSRKTPQTILAKGHLAFEPNDSNNEQKIVEVADFALRKLMLLHKEVTDIQEVSCS